MICDIILDYITRRGAGTNNPTTAITGGAAGLRGGVQACKNQRGRETETERGSERKSKIIRTRVVFSTSG